MNRSPLKQWVVDARGQMKVEELVRKLTVAGYRTRNEEPVKAGTIRGWEAPAGGEPPKAVIPYLERIFKSKAPVEGAPPDIAALATAIEHQAAAINALATRLDAMGQDARGTQDALIDALAVIARLVPATRTDVVTRLLGAIEESHRREDSADPTRQGTGR